MSRGTVLQDLRIACREVMKNRWFACVTVLTLALGIGANTAVFAVVNQLLLNPLPYPDSDRLAYLRLGSARYAFGYVTPTFVASAWRAHGRLHDGIEAYASRDVLAYDDAGARIARDAN
jgi:hypothetical protein